MFFKHPQVSMSGNSDSEVWNRLYKELSVVTYKYDSAGRILAETKDELKKRGGKSPDIADALLMTLLFDWEKTVKHRQDTLLHRKRKRKKLRRDWRVV